MDVDTELSESRLPSHHATVEDVPDIDDTCQMPNSESNLEDVHCPDPSRSTHPGMFVPAPRLAEAEAAWRDVRRLLRPCRKGGIGFKPFNGDETFKHRLQMMRATLWNYSRPIGSMPWKKASIEAVQAHDSGSGTADSVRQWCRAYIADRDDLPYNRYGTWNESILEDDELVSEIHLHLQGVGKERKAKDVVDFFKSAEVQEKYELDDYAPCLSTAQRWMHRMDYRWGRGPKGQYIDGHEREDVVAYRQEIFLPTLANHEDRIRTYDRDGNTIPYSGPRPMTRRLVIWFHDESTFYANDRRRVFWVHKDEKAVPEPKGEGPSLMVADFISADYGWLGSPDGDESARVYFKAGKEREGYFTSDEIVAQLDKAMDVIKKLYPDDDHLFILDNATTHLKRADDAISARKMPKGPSPARSGGSTQRFGVDIKTKGADGNLVHGANGKPLKHRVNMSDTVFADGTTQYLYYPDAFPEHPELAGKFKGMAQLLIERYPERRAKIKGLKTECSKFNCAKGRTDCCCRRMLFVEKDFADVQSLVEEACTARGIPALFLPKFHPELNPIEQCWGYAKRRYRSYPASSKEADLERNVRTALQAVPIESIRRCVFVLPPR